jgi:hypothetical protein
LVFEGIEQGIGGQDMLKKINGDSLPLLRLVYRGLRRSIIHRARVFDGNSMPSIGLKRNYVSGLSYAGR